MKEEFEKYESTIKKKHSFNWTPKYQESFTTNLKSTQVILIAVKAFEKLEWEVVYQDENIAEAKCFNDYGNWSEKISVSILNGIVTVKSVTLGSEMWDQGKNSKRVKLFIYAFQLTEQEFDQEALAELEEEIEREANWDDYEIPETLPQPKKQITPRFWISSSSGIVIALFLGYLVALFSVHTIYVIGVYELAVGFVIGYSFKLFLKVSNLSLYQQLHYLLIAMILIVYISNQYFQYLIILSESPFQRIGFLEFMQIRFEAGLTIKSLNLGWIGLIISYILQLVLTYLIAGMKFNNYFNQHILNRVYPEVVDFAFYHFVKEKTEEEVRAELSKKGWSNTEDQNEIFQAIGTLQGISDVRRME